MALQVRNPTARATAKPAAAKATAPGKKPSTPAPPGDRPPSDSARGAILAGLVIVLVFFGAFGGWAAIAPLNGAVVGDAIVKVEGNRKSVEHLDGGIVKVLNVKEGDHVQQGDVLIVLDDTDRRAEVDVLSQQLALLDAVEARLEAERDQRDAIEFPPELIAQADDPSVAAAMANQREEFAGRRTALEGQKQVLRQRSAQLDEAITGNQAQRQAYQEQLDSVVAEKDSLADLLSKGIISRSRTLQLERTESGIRGQLAQVDADIGKARQQIVEISEQIAQLGKDRAAEVANDLRETRTKLLDVKPRLNGARATLERTTIRAPYSGTVVDLAVFSVGGVIGRGERILDIVPDDTSLVVEARIRVEDIAELGPGMGAEVHFTAYKQRVTPLIHGVVREISADRLTDERTGVAYYTAAIAVNQDELAKSPEIQLYPGMPATVMITTEARTALQYLLGPLTASFDRAFRQR